MTEKIIIASDSTTDLSPELIEKYGVVILPLGINLGEKRYLDGVDINPDFIYENYKNTGELPKTSAANIGDFEEFFHEHTKDGNSLIMFLISSGMSCTYNNACLAAENFPNVHVVDTKNLSTGGGLLVLSACEMAESGMNTKDIAEKCRELSERVDASFVIDSLEFLRKGGRCTALQALGANLLKLKPLIQVKNGTMGVTKKYRGKFEVVLEEYIADKLADLDSIENDHVFITHAGCDDALCEKCVELVKQKGYFKNVHFSRAGCTISSHCGANTLGVLFIRKTPLE